MFKISSGKGFQITFSNGITISVQFGPGNYADHRDAEIAVGRVPVPGTDRVVYASDIIAGQQGSRTAEIALWDADGNWHNFGYDTVKGRVPADEVAQWIAWAASCKVSPGAWVSTIPTPR